MEPLPAKIDELLSGMLDGVLSENELVELERAMTNDPSLQVRLDEMATTRSALLRGRPRGRLGTGFAERVVAEAKKRVQEGTDSSEWFAPAGVPSRNHSGNRSFRPNVIFPQTIQQPIDTVPAVKRAWVYGSIAVAASLALIFVSIRNNDRQGLLSDDVLVQIPSQDSESKSELDAMVSASAQELLEGKMETVPVPSNLSPTDRMGSSAIASNENSSPAEVAALPSLDLKLAPDIAPSLAFATDTSKPTGKPAVDASLIPGTADIRLGDFALMFVDITISDKARDQKVVDAILRAHDIFQTEDLVLSDDQVNSLVASGIVAKQSPELAPATVLLLQGTSGKLSDAFVEMMQDTGSVLEWAFSFNIAPEAKQLADQLKEIRIAEGNQGSARRLTASSKSSPFAGGMARNQVGREAMRKIAKPSLLPGHAKVPSTVLLVVRVAE